MRHLIQLHNYDKNGLPLGANFQLGLSDNCSIHTRNPLILDEVGSRMFLIFAVGKPRTFFLWDSFIIKKVEEADEQEEDKKTLYGPSHKKCPIGIA